MGDLGERIRKLADEFEKWHAEHGVQLGEVIGAASDVYGPCGPFPPYIPFAGSRWDDSEPRILLYATAQNIVPDDTYYSDYSIWGGRQLVERLYYSWHRIRKHPVEKVDFSEILINPYQSGVLPALAGVFLHTRYGETIAELPLVHERVAVSNWYKFSLWHWNKKGRMANLNPPDLPKVSRRQYERMNDQLVRMEIEVLQPTHVIVAFRSRKYANLSRVIPECEVIQVSDPACLLHGCRPKPNKMPEQKIMGLVSKYVGQFPSDYDPDETRNPYRGGMVEHVENYLLYWAEQFGRKRPKEDIDV